MCYTAMIVALSFYADISARRGRGGVGTGEAAGKVSPRVEGRREGARRLGTKGKGSRDVRRVQKGVARTHR